MKAITLRNIPREVIQVIRRRAQEKRISLNRAVIELLREALGVSGGKKGKPLHDDLDFLIGTWSEEEASAFDGELESQRGVDGELWK